MVKSKKYEKAYGKELLEVAKADFETAKVLHENNIKRKENIFFHVQQSIEKALKSYLCYIGQPIPLVHDLILLVDRLPDGCDLPYQNELTDLSQFASSRRYYMGYDITDEEEITSVIAAAQEILQWVEEKLN